MNIARTPNHLFTVGKFVAFQIDDNDYDGLIEKTSDVGVLLTYFDQGKERQIAKFFSDIRLTDQVVNDWWGQILNPGDEIIPIDSVLGDSEDTKKLDAIGRGKKGYGHGSIDWKPVTRKRRNGHIWKTSQPWYQWEDEAGKHCRYLRKGRDLTVQKMIDQGATVEQILEAIGKSRDKSRGKTR